MSYGEKIAELRKSKGMTQATLGAKLNVTYQAVSKWERDESDPDFATMCKIAKLFGVPLTYFEETDGAVQMSPDESPAQPAPEEEITEQAEEEAVAATDAVAPIEPAPETAEPTVIENPAPAAPITPVKPVVHVTPAPSSAPVRPAAATPSAASIKSNNERAQNVLTYEERKVLRRRNIGLIAGGAITLLVFIGSIFLAVNSTSATPWFSVGFCVFVLIFGFTFFSQLFWGGFIINVVMLGGKVIGTPGIIFSFDLDGFIFLIAMKILFALLRLFVFVLTIIFFVLVGILLSPFSFAPQIIKMSRGEELD